MYRVYIGIDNGATGTIGIIAPGGVQFFKTPTKEVRNYQKRLKMVTRINHVGLYQILNACRPLGCSPEKILITTERPMVNPARFEATASGLRAYEALLVVAECLHYPVETIDSKQWQKVFLDPKCKGADELKNNSKLKGKALFWEHAPLIQKHGDADGLFIAKYALQKHGGFSVV